MTASEGTMSLDVANVSAGWFDQIGLPRKSQSRGASKYGVILLHGASNAGLSTGYDWLLSGWPSLCTLAAVLKREGIPWVAAAMDGNHYAKPIVTQNDANGYINKAAAYLSAQSGCSTSKYHVMGVSMGGGTAAMWAARNPTKVASVTGLIPMASLHHLYTQYSGLPVVGGFASGIATAWATTPTFRSVTDAVFNGTTTVTSATAAFTTGDQGSNLVPNAAGILSPDTKIVTRVSATQVTLDKPALVSSSGNTIGIAGPLPMAGLTGADIAGVHAPVLSVNNIPSRFYYASDDPFIPSADVTALATAANGQAINLGATGHDNDAGNAMAAYNGGSDFSDWIDWIKTHGA